VIKRTIEISREPAHLAVRDEQLLVLRKDEPPKRLPARPPNLAGSIPCEDIGVIMADSSGTSYSHTALATLAEHGAAIVVCGRDHHPVGMFLPISRNTQLLARLDAQTGSSKPARKRLWASIVKAKIRAQAEALPPTNACEAARGRLRQLAREVKSGDTTNAEAQAAVIYWPMMFSVCHHVLQPFRRRPGDRSAPPPNNLLDYGYAALRAAVARALVSAGLLPALGIQHRGRSNPFSLADDLMEPLRPLVDRRVRWLAEQGELSLDQPNKAVILGVLTEEVGIDGSRGPLLVSVTRYVTSFVRVLSGEADRLEIPTSGTEVAEG
jgi:CRISPR-associated protein Cas1